MKYSTKFLIFSGVLFLIGLIYILFEYPLARQPFLYLSIGLPILYLIGISGFKVRTHFATKRIMKDRPDEKLLFKNDATVGKFQFTLVLTDKRIILAKYNGKEIFDEIEYEDITDYEITDVVTVYDQEQENTIVFYSSKRKEIKEIFKKYVQAPPKEYFKIIYDDAVITKGDNSL